MEKPCRIVLFETNHPSNIGAAARAMKTMGESSLYLVKPSFFPSPAANALASGGVDILDHAVVTNTLNDAINDCQLILATSGRDEVMNFPILELRDAAILARQYQQAGNQIAFIFGTERTGLTNDELKLCHYHVRIPTADEFSSLNLAQAVQVVCYELLMASLIPQSPCDSSLTKGAKAPIDKGGCHEVTGGILAVHANSERFYTRLETLLRKVDFLKPGHDKIIMQKMRRLFQKAQLEENEVIILLGIISNLERNLK